MGRELATELFCFHISLHRVSGEDILQETGKLLLELVVSFLAEKTFVAKEEDFPGPLLFFQQSHRLSDTEPGSASQFLGQKKLVRVGIKKLLNAVRKITGLQSAQVRQGPLCLDDPELLAGYLQHVPSAQDRVEIERTDRKRISRQNGQRFHEAQLGQALLSGVKALLFHQNHERIGHRCPEVELHSLAVSDRRLGGFQNLQVHVEEKAGAHSPWSSEKHPSAHLIQRDLVKIDSDPLPGMSLFDQFVVGFEGPRPGLDA